MKKKPALIIGICCWLIFAVFAIAVGQNATWIHVLDQWGYQLTQPTSAGKTTIMIVLTHCGDPIIIQSLTIIIALILWWQEKINQSLWYVCLQFVGYALVILVKYNVLRPRPTNKLFPANGYSFPSGHTFSTTIFTLTILAIILPLLKTSSSKVILRIIGGIWILTIMVTRVYLRDHFTGDVIAGFFLASGWWLLMNAERHHLASWLIRPITKAIENDTRS